MHPVGYARERPRSGPNRGHFTPIVKALGMKQTTGTVAAAKAAEAKRKVTLSARLDREAVLASEKIRNRFDADRQAFAKRYGGVANFSSEVEKD